MVKYNTIIKSSDSQSGRRLGTTALEAFAAIQKIQNHPVEGFLKAPIVFFS